MRGRDRRLDALERRVARLPDVPPAEARREVVRLTVHHLESGTAGDVQAYRELRARVTRDRWATRREPVAGLRVEFRVEPWRDPVIVPDSPPPPEPVKLRLVRDEEPARPNMGEWRIERDERREWSL